VQALTRLLRLQPLTVLMLGWEGRWYLHCTCSSSSSRRGSFRRLAWCPNSLMQQQQVQQG
jgi:hypothetical protein